MCVGGGGGEGRGIAVTDILLGQLISNFGVPEKNPGHAPDFGTSQKSVFLSEKRTFCLSVTIVPTLRLILKISPLIIATNKHVVVKLDTHINSTLTH